MAKMRCGKCGGSGKVNDIAGSYTCPTCNGNGFINVYKPCTKCGGSGEIPDIVGSMTCPRCRGTGNEP
ncbi:MAG: hypothetical protein WBM02_11695 [bacterium]